MRLMLGTQDNPRLLVNVKDDYNPAHFDFWVANGAWGGTYTNGCITVHHPYNPHSRLDKIEILCSDQDRLRSGDNYSDYRVVFANFNNPNYVAPKPKHVVFDDIDGDIPF